MEDQKPVRWPRTLPSNYTPLRGLFQDLTREDFAQFCSWQCSLREIAGRVGVSVEKLTDWVRRAYRLDCDTVLDMLHQSGLIEIRKAAFDYLKKSATLINQQYNRFIPVLPPENNEGQAAIEALMKMLEPEEDPDSCSEAGEDGEEAE